MSRLLQWYPGDGCLCLAVNVLLQVTVVILLAWALACSVARRGAAGRHGIWLCALVVVLLSPLTAALMNRAGIATFVVRLPAGSRAETMPPIATSSPPASLDAAVARSHRNAPLDIRAIATDEFPPNEVQAAARSSIATAPAPLSAVEWLRAIAVAALVIWALGALYLLARLLGRGRALRRLVRTACPIEDERLRSMLDKVRRLLKLKTLPRVAVWSGEAACITPITAGIFRPVIVLSTSLFQTLREDELRDVLVHECAHVLRRDPLVGLLQRIAGIAFWPYPLVRLMNRELTRAREEVCDNYVLHFTDGPQYAQTLFDLAERVVPLSPRLAQLGVLQPCWRLEHRVAGLLDARRNTVIRLNRFTALALAAAFLTLMLLAAGTKFVRAEPRSANLAAAADELAAAPQPADAKAAPPQKPGESIRHGASPQESVPRSEKTTRSIGAANPNDVSLGEAQRKYRDWTEEYFFGMLDPSPWQKLGSQEKAATEEKMLKQLSDGDPRERISAINALAGLGSKKAVPGLLKIAADRSEKDNRERWMAVRALGIIGDQSVVPELVHLTYHYNMNTRFWAQISLVRLTGQNFGRDVTAWRNWWQQQGKTTPIGVETVKWATSPAMLKYSDPKAQEEMDRQWVAQRKKLQPPQTPRDLKLNEIQRAMRNASEQHLAQRLSPSRWQALGPQEKAAEDEQWLKQLSSPSESARIMAIYVLTVLKSKKAVPGLIAIATERKEKDNRDRWMACRALGIVGDSGVVPELVPLTYHYNRDTRLWAQISLVRLTGENFGRDVAAWRQWWEKQGGKPPIALEPVAWATSPERRQWADPKSMDESDQQLVARSQFARQTSQTQGSNFWTKYERWAAVHKGMRGVNKNPEEDKRLLAELVQNAFVVTFRPTQGFAPKTPGAFLAKFADKPSLKSDPNGLGGGSFFRTKVKDGVLIGSFLTARPEETRKAIEATPSVEVLSVEKLTPEMFIRHDASPQESLK